jgi:hypothetical protein
VPVILRYKGWRFFFFSNEGNPVEPAHVHIRKGEKTVKIWLAPTISVATSYDVSPREMQELVGVVVKNVDRIRRSWHEYFSD